MSRLLSLREVSLRATWQSHGNVAINEGDCFEKFRND